MTMTTVGIICWVIACIFGGLYQYECRNSMTGKGIVLKGIAAVCVVAYAVILIAMFGQASDAAVLFVVSLIFVAIADILIAYLEHIGDGSSASVLNVVSSSPNRKWVLLSLSGILYICSFFQQIVAFLKGLSHYAVATDYVMPFLVFFMLPPILIVTGGIIAKFPHPDTDMRLFILGAFLVLLSSALFAAGFVFGFALFQSDVAHGTWIIFGTSLYFLSLTSIELRYGRPDFYDNKYLRVISRAILFLGRMTLAGCAFLL